MLKKISNDCSVGVPLLTKCLNYLEPVARFEFAEQVLDCLKSIDTTGENFVCYQRLREVFKTAKSNDQKGTYAKQLLAPSRRLSPDSIEYQLPPRYSAKQDAESTLPTPTQSPTYFTPQMYNSSAANATFAYNASLPSHK